MSYSQAAIDEVVELFRLNGVDDSDIILMMKMIDIDLDLERPIEELEWDTSTVNWYGYDRKP